MRRFAGALVIGTACALAGCQGSAPSQSVEAAHETPARSDLEAGKLAYRTGDFAIAEAHFRRATNNDPFSAEAWLGLAAAYDQLGRFDMADRAYDQTRTLVGTAPQLMNNLGYSHMLRGNRDQALDYLARALSVMPNDPVVNANRAVLDGR
jgi:Flp pilus assembly protein TadD